jgi:hypothetical protein
VSTVAILSVIWLRMGGKNFIRKAQSEFLRKLAALIFCEMLMTVQILKELDKD